MKYLSFHLENSLSLCCHKSPFRCGTTDEIDEEPAAAAADGSNIIPAGDEDLPMMSLSEAVCK